MFDKMTGQLSFHGTALSLRAQHQRIIASNIANADTPGYMARDFRFGDALRQAAGAGSGLGLQETTGWTDGPPPSTGITDPRHIPLPALTSRTGPDGQASMGYAVQTEPSLDNSTVDLDRERSSFVNNAVRYEATLRFINGSAKTMLGAIQGQ